MQAASRHDSDGDSKPLYPPEIQSMSEKYTWPSNNGYDKNIVCSDVFSDETLSRLKGLIGCIMVKSTDKPVIYLGASSEETIHLAISRLDNLYNYAVSFPKDHMKNKMRLPLTSRVHSPHSRTAPIASTPKIQTLLNFLYNVCMM